MLEPNTGRRLSRAVLILGAIDSRRRREGDPGVGSMIERMIIGHELRELEDEIYHDPGALAGRVDTDAAHRKRRR